jgi:hypothetical protein
MAGAGIASGVGGLDSSAGVDYKDQTLSLAMRVLDVNASFSGSKVAVSAAALAATNRWRPFRCLRTAVHCSPARWDRRRAHVARPRASIPQRILAPLRDFKAFVNTMWRSVSNVGLVAGKSACSRLQRLACFAQQTFFTAADVKD